MQIFLNQAIGQGQDFLFVALAVILFNGVEIINIFSIQMDGTHKNAYGSKLDLAVNGSNVNVRPSF